MENADYKKGNFERKYFKKMPEPIKKSVGGFKDKVISLFKANTPEQTVQGEERN